MRLAVRKSLTPVSVTVSAALFASAVAFGTSRDFGVFLLAIPVLGSLLLLSLICVGVATVSDRVDRGIRTSAALILLAPVAAYAAAQLHDRVLFLGWSLAHRAELRSAASRDTLITGWDSWGMAGSENDSYLVSDRLDDSSDVASAERWRVRMGLSCPIVATARMRKNIYIVTTYECTLDAVVIPG